MREGKLLPQNGRFNFCLSNGNIQEWFCQIFVWACWKCLSASSGQGVCCCTCSGGSRVTNRNNVKDKFPNVWTVQRASIDTVFCGFEFFTLLELNVLKTNICSSHTSVLHLQHIYTELWSTIIAFFRVSLLRLYLCESVFRGLWVEAGKLLVNTIKSREMLLQTAPHTEHPGWFLLAFQKKNLCLFKI